MNKNMSEKPFIIFNNEIVQPIAPDCDCACPQVLSIDNQKITVKSIDKQEFMCNDFIVENIEGTKYKAAIVEKTNTFFVFDQSVNNFLNLFNKPKKIEDIYLDNRIKWSNETTKELVSDFIENSVIVSDFNQKILNQAAITSLTAWFHVSNQCNFNCHYCYVERSNKQMLFSTGKKIIDSLQASAEKNNLKSIRIKYAGGEPLLNFQLIKRLHGHISEKVNQHNIKFEEIILTNGSLLNENIINWIVDNQLELMVSLDSLKNQEKVVQNIINCIDKGIKPYISITLCNENALELPELVSWVTKYNLRFNINFFRNSEKVPNNNYQLDDDLIANSIIDSFRSIKQHLPLANSLLSIIDRANFSFPHLNSCGVGSNYLAFDSDGNISSCHMKITDSIIKQNEYPADLIKSIQYGNKIENCSIEENSSCFDCKWKYWCTSGCPMIKPNNKNASEKSPNCEIYKKVFPELIKLEGMRLIAKNKLDK